MGSVFDLELVDADEVDVWVVLGRFAGRLAQGKADGDDDVVAGVDELLDVVGIVLGVLGLDVLDRLRPSIEAKLLAGALNAFPGRLVETAVVDATHVGDQTDLQIDRRCGGLVHHCRRPAPAGATGAAQAAKTSRDQRNQHAKQGFDWYCAYGFVSFVKGVTLARKRWIESAG